MKRRRPVTVAITGGIGAGKSEALKAFARRGATTLSADEVVHRLYKRDDVRQALVARWGNRILDGAGEVDRAAVAEIVFADREELQWLERLVHPLTIEEQRRWREEAADGASLLVVEVPLLYETGGEARFDAVVVVTAPHDVRRARSRAATAEREARLLPDEEKVRRADYAFVNDGSVDELDAWVGRVFDELLA